MADSKNGARLPALQLGRLIVAEQEEGVGFSHDADLRGTLMAVTGLEPVTVFHEPINIRAENITRIQSEATRRGLQFQTEVFATRELWQDYALESLRTVERLANELGIADRLHLWHDKSLGSRSAIRRMTNPQKHLEWLQKWWNQVSKWPGPSDEPMR